MKYISVPMKLSVNDLCMLREVKNRTYDYLEWLDETDGILQDVIDALEAEGVSIQEVIEKEK